MENLYWRPVPEIVHSKKLAAFQSKRVYVEGDVPRPGHRGLWEARSMA